MRGSEHERPGPCSLLVAIHEEHCLACQRGICSLCFGVEKCACKLCLRKASSLACTRQPHACTRQTHACVGGDQKLTLPCAGKRGVKSWEIALCRHQQLPCRISPSGRERCPWFSGLAMGALCCRRRAPGSLADLALGPSCPSAPHYDAQGYAIDYSPGRSTVQRRPRTYDAPFEPDEGFTHQ